MGAASAASAASERRRGSRTHGRAANDDGDSLVFSGIIENWETDVMKITFLSFSTCRKILSVLKDILHL